MSVLFRNNYKVKGDFRYSRKARHHLWRCEISWKTIWSSFQCKNLCEDFKTWVFKLCYLWKSSSAPFPCFVPIWFHFNWTRPINKEWANHLHLVNCSYPRTQGKRSITNVKNILLRWHVLMSFPQTEKLFHGSWDSENIFLIYQLNHFC